MGSLFTLTQHGMLSYDCLFLLIGRALLAHSDALCAAATPIMNNVWKGENCLTELSVLQGLKNPLLSCYFIRCLLLLRFVGFLFFKNKHKYLA